jgi:hypothetical protein
MMKLNLRGLHFAKKNTRVHAHAHAHGNRETSTSQKEVGIVRIPPSPRTS